MQLGIFDAPVRPVASTTPEDTAGRPAVELRPYQVAAVERVLEQHAAGARSTLVVMATGTGKTTVFSGVVARSAGPALVLAHRDELIRQAADRIHRQTGMSVAVEKAEERAARGADVVVASVQSLRPERIASLRFRFGEFPLIVVDEAHHAVSKSYREILDAFPTSKILGVTATPDRADEQAMGQVFDEIGYVYEIGDAIADGWLCPIRATQVFCDDINLADVKTVAGDLNQGELDAVMSTEAVLHQVARPTLELAGGRRTIVFTTSVENAHRMAEVFNRYRPGCAGAVDGSMDSIARKRVLNDHRAGRIQFLCNVAVLTEGYDDPAIACVAMARPTKSRALYAQMAGRGTRIHPGKEDLLLLDFAGNAGRHALVSAADILGGKYGDDVVEKAKQKIADEPGTDIRQALTEAEAEIRAEAERRRKEDEARRRAQAQAAVRYQKQDIDPFAVLGVSDPVAEFGGRFGDKPASEKQLERLAIWKIDVVTGLTSRQAERLIKQEYARRVNGWCTYAQAKFLQRHGYETKGITRVQASQLMDALKANGWKPLLPIVRESILGARR